MIGLVVELDYRRFAAVGDDLIDVGSRALWRHGQCRQIHRQVARRTDHHRALRCAVVLYRGRHRHGFEQVDDRIGRLEAASQRGRQYGRADIDERAGHVVLQPGRAADRDLRVIETDLGPVVDAAHHRRRREGRDNLAGFAGRQLHRHLGAVVLAPVAEAHRQHHVDHRGGRDAGVADREGDGHRAGRVAGERIAHVLPARQQVGAHQDRMRHAGIVAPPVVGLPGPVAVGCGGQHRAGAVGIFDQHRAAGEGAEGAP